MHEHPGDQPTRTVEVQMSTNKTTAQLEPGTYSHGTLRDEDIADMFETIAGVIDCPQMRGMLDELEGFFGEANHGMFVGSEISEIISELFDHVSEHHTPDRFYFGSHEGDASDFGIWADEDSDEDSEELIGLHKLAEDRFAWPGGYELFFITDDAGVLCAPCVIREWDEIRTANPGDGWNVTGWSHTGECDSPTSCDHCSYVIIADDEFAEVN